MAFAMYSGGKALEHEVSFIGKQARIAYLTTDGNPVTSIGKNDLCGLRVGYHNEKSKVNIPYFSGEFDLYFRDVPGLNKFYGDIDYFRELLKIGVENGAIVKQGGGIYAVGGEKFKGESELENGLWNSKKLVEEIYSKSPVYLQEPVNEADPDSADASIEESEAPVGEEGTPVDTKKGKKGKK